MERPLTARGLRRRAGLLTLAILLAALALLATLGFVGCERRSKSNAPAPAAPATTQPATPADKQGVPVLLMLGDSLTAGFGLPQEQAYPALIQERIHQAGLGWRVVNAGVSGDTTAGGLARLDWLLRQRVDVLLLALGANDGLRGQSTDAMERNLEQIIQRAQAAGIRVVLAGMRMPSNYGEEYTRRFAAVFHTLAERYGLAFIPFLLEGVAARPELNQADGIHPNEEGARRVAELVWPTLEQVLREEAAKK